MTLRNSSMDTSQDIPSKQRRLCHPSLLEPYEDRVTTKRVCAPGKEQRVQPPHPRNRKRLVPLSLIPNMDATENPVVRALIKEVIRHGKGAIALLKGTLFFICDATTRAVLFLCDTIRYKNSTARLVAQHMVSNVPFERAIASRSCRITFLEVPAQRDCK